MNIYVMYAYVYMYTSNVYIYIYIYIYIYRCCTLSIIKNERLGKNSMTCNDH